MVAQAIHADGGKPRFFRSMWIALGAFGAVPACHLCTSINHPPPGLKAPQKESRRKNLTAETYTPHGVPQVSIRFIPTDISESLLRLQDTMMTLRLGLLICVRIPGLALIAGYLAGVSYSDLIPGPFTLTPSPDDSAPASSGIIVNLPLFVSNL